MANNFLFVKIIGEMPEVLNELKNALDELMKREAVFSSGFRFSSLLSKKSRLEPTSGIVGCTRKKKCYNQRMTGGGLLSQNGTTNV